jgi:hypothetical protein
VLTGRPSRSEAVESAALGLRALARVPSASAPEIVARLEDEGIMVTATRADRAWAAVPISFTFLLAAGAAAGLLAGLQGVWPLLALTPAFVVLVGYSAMRGIAKPVYSDASDREVPTALVHALAQLPPGQAREITAELSQAAREVLAVDARAELSPGLLRAIEEVLPVAAAAALDLAALDQSISDFESRSRGDDAVPETFTRGREALRLGQGLDGRSCVIDATGKGEARGGIRDAVGAVGRRHVTQRHHDLQGIAGRLDGLKPTRTRECGLSRTANRHESDLSFGHRTGQAGPHQGEKRGGEEEHRSVVMQSRHTDSPGKVCSPESREGELLARDGMFRKGTAPRA